MDSLSRQHGFCLSPPCSCQHPCLKCLSQIHSSGGQTYPLSQTQLVSSQLKQKQCMTIMNCFKEETVLCHLFKFSSPFIFNNYILKGMYVGIPINQPIKIAVRFTGYHSSSKVCWRNATIWQYTVTVYG